MSHSWSNRDSRGAVAITFAICALLFFALAAVAVDLGNAMDRRRQTQTQADFAALAGGAFLPGTKVADDDAVEAVVKYLNDNQPTTDGTMRCRDGGPCVTGAQLVDGDYSNGEVDFTSNGQRLTVTTAPARVQFGIASALGKDATHVRGVATVGIGTPGRPLPMFLPENCATGTAILKDGTPGNNNPNLTFVPASGNGNNLPQIVSVDPIDPPGGVATDLTLKGSKFNNGLLEADFFHEASNDRIPANVANNHPATMVSDAEARVTLPLNVYNTPGYWEVRLHNDLGWSKTIGRFYVGNPFPIANGCGVSATGDFGMLFSPRAGVGQQNDATSLNIAKGLDHLLVPWPQKTALPMPSPVSSPTNRDTCRTGGNTPIPGAVLDIAGQVEPDCVNIQNGFLPDVVADGLITGGSAAGSPYTGRLDTDTLSGCDRNGTSNEATRIGVTINDDVLSCFLPSGVSVGDVIGSNVTGQARNSIDPLIFESPRYALVPVIHYEFNPQNGFYPIARWQPVFITDESPASTHGQSFATSINGVTVQNNNVTAVQVVAINTDALPLSAPGSGGGGWIPYVGSGPKLVRLVN